MGGFHLFTLANVPVSVSPWYFLLVVYLMPRQDLRSGLISAACVTLSLLAHEFGHALVARKLQLKPQILLHGFGGLTGHRTPQTPKHEALIIAAGPAAGLSLAAVAYASRAYLPVDSAAWIQALNTLAWINVFWSAFNLLPMWPMDGGQLFRLGASKLLKPERGERLTHVVSIALIVLVALASYKYRFGMMMLMFLALTAFQNIQALTNRPSKSSEPRPENEFARDLLSRAQAAYERGDEDEAARLSHQLRGEHNVPAPALARAWAMLGVITTRRGEYEEALSYLKRAPDEPEVVEATAQCLYQLGMDEALAALVTSRAFGQLPSDTRSEIIRAIEERHAPSSA